MFLLRCNKPALSDVLEQVTPNKLLQRKIITQDFFQRCISNLGADDINIVTNSLTLLSTFLRSIFSKKYMSRSSDLITLLGGFGHIDAVFFEFLDKLSNVISGSISSENDIQPEAFEQQLLIAQVNAIRVTTVAAGGSLNTSLETYFMSHDIFASIISFINSPNADVYIGDAFSLIGVLATYGKLETHNPYRVRLADIVDHQSMLKTIRASGHVWQICLDQYQNKLDNQGYFKGPIASPYSVAYSIASWFGLGRNTDEHNNTQPGGELPPQQKATNEESNELKYPLEIMSLTIATYEAVIANKVYAKLLLECPATPYSEPISNPSTNTGKDGSETNAGPQPSRLLDNRSPPFAIFLSLCTYLFQNQHKAQRAALYSRLCLLILHTIIETPIFVTSPASALAPSLLVDDSLRTKSIIVARQRSPYLPIVTFPEEKGSKPATTNGAPAEGSDLDTNKDPKSGRLLLEGILDALQCALRYNMKKNIDAEMYVLALTNVFQIIHFLRQSKFRLQYHWTELWRTLMSLVRFINSHPTPKSENTSDNIGSGDPDYTDMVSLIVLILATSLIHGETFLGNSAEYDDLLYKVIENRESIDKLKRLFSKPLATLPSMSVLQTVISHYASLFPQSATGNVLSGKKQLSAQEVTSAIREGYQTLSLYQHATGTNGSSNNRNGNVNGTSASNASDGLQSPSEISGYLMYNPLPKLREPDERSYFKKLMRQIIEDIQNLHQNL